MAASELAFEPCKQMKYSLLHNQCDFSLRPSAFVARLPRVPSNARLMRQYYVGGTHKLEVLVVIYVCGIRRKQLEGGALGLQWILK